MGPLKRSCWPKQKRQHVVPRRGTCLRWLPPPPPAALRPHLQNCDLLSRIFITTDEASETLRLALRQSQVRQPGMAAETDGGALGSIGCPASSRGRPCRVRTLPGLPTLPALAGGGVGRSSQCLALSAVPRHKPDRPYRSSVDRRHLPPHSHG